MNATVDDLLGDIVSYKLAAAPAFSNIKAFVLFDHADPGFGAIDELNQRPRLKVAKAIVPAPSMDDRFRAAKLDAGLTTWRPVGKIDEDGGYWIFEIQKAST